MKKAIVLSIMCLMALSINAQTYVDLGLPSGTRWKTVNEINQGDNSNFFTYDEAMSKFDKQLPTLEQLYELKNECTWVWDDAKKGYTVKGLNGKSIFFPATGYHLHDGEISYEGEMGMYWSSMSFSCKDCDAWSFFFSLEEVIGSWQTSRFDGCSVRLVEKSGSVGKKAKKK